MQKENENKKKRAVIYLWVAGGRETDTFNSLAAQEHFCRRYAEANGYDVVKVINETGGGQRTLERSGIMQLLNYCAHVENGIRAVIVAGFDRLTRNHTDYKWVQVLLKQCGVEIDVATAVESSTPTDRFVERIKTLLDDYAAENCPSCNGAQDYSPQDDL